MKMQVRLATLEDVERITEMHQSYIQSWHPQEYFERLIDVESPLVIVAVKDHKLIGYTACRVEGQYTHLVSMGVCPRERTKGVGSGMTLAIVERAVKRGLKGIYGHVRGSNAVAIAVYKKCEFTFTLVDEYEDGDEKLEFFMAVHSNMESKHRQHLKY